MAIKSVKSKKDLDALALSQGATVTDRSGKRFNTAKKKAVKQAPRPMAEPKPAAAVAPAPAPPPPPDNSSKVVAEKIEAASKASVMMMAEIKQQIAQIQLQTPEVITEWDFDFIRDDKGYLKRIKATAGYGQRTVN